MNLQFELYLPRKVITHTTYVSKKQITKCKTCVQNLHEIHLNNIVVVLIFALKVICKTYLFLMFNTEKFREGLG